MIVHNELHKDCFFLKKRKKRKKKKFNLYEKKELEKQERYRVITNVCNL